MGLGIIGCPPLPEKGITEEEAKALLDRALEVYNEGNLDLVEEIFAPEFVVHNSNQPEDIVGLDAYKNYISTLRTGFPDFKVTFDEIIAANDKIVTRFTFSGTHEGPFGELPATGKKVSVSGLSLGYVADGKLTENWIIYNVLDMNQQLGFTITPPAGE